MIQILDCNLEKEVLETIGIDREGIFKMYRDLNVSRSYFERMNFVMEEPVDESLSEKVWAGFLSFDMSRSLNLALGQQNENS